MFKYLKTDQEFTIIDEPIESLTKIKFYGTYLPKIPKNTSLVTTSNCKRLIITHRDNGLYRIILKYIYMRMIDDIDSDKESDINNLFGISPLQESCPKINYMITIKDILKLRHGYYFEYYLLNGDILKIKRHYNGLECHIGSQKISSYMCIENNICIPYFRQVQSKGAHRSYQ